MPHSRSHRLSSRPGPIHLLHLLIGLVLTAALLAPSQGSAQSESASEATSRSQASLESPRQAMFQFLRGIQSIRRGEEQSWPAVLETLDFSRMEAPATIDRQMLARNLWEILNRIREIRQEELPDVDQLAADQDSYLFFPRLFNQEDHRLVRELESGSYRISFARDEQGQWRFDARTVAAVPEFYQRIAHKTAKVHAEVFDDAQTPLRQWIPLSLTGQFLEIEYWQWIGFFMLILLGVILDYLSQNLTRPLLLTALRRAQVPEERLELDRPTRPLGLMVAGILVLVGLPLLGLPYQASLILRTAAQLFTILAVVWAGWRVIDLLTEVLAVKAGRTRTKFDDILVPLVRKAAKIFLIAFGLIYAADSLNIPIGPMLASLGIGGVAFAFAAKDTVENFFGSVAVLLDRPFDVGDWVVIDGKEGIIEEVGFRSTRVRTFYNSLITMPNANLVRAAVDNYGRRRYRRWNCHLRLQLDTPPEKLVAFTEGLRELVRTHPYTRKDFYQIWCHEFGESSLNVLLYIFFEVPDWNTELRERERMFLDVVRLADRLQVHFAFPTQTVHLFNERQPAAPPDTRFPPPQSMTDRRAMVQGIQAAQALVANQSWQKERPGPQTYGQSGPTPIPVDEQGNPRPGDEPPQENNRPQNPTQA